MSAAPFAVGVTREAALKKKLKDLIIAEIKANQTRSGWGGTGVPISSTQFSLTDTLREQVNARGRKYGCHTCPSRVENDADQPWVGDHSYPTNLSDHVKEVLNSIAGFADRGKTYLFPQCHQCSGQQANLVLKLNLMKQSEVGSYIDSNKEEVYRLIHGTLVPKVNQNCVEASGPVVTPNEGDAIQLMGSENGCHSDSRHKFPTTRYIADHAFPQEFCTGYMPQVMKELGISDLIPKQLELRPQCYRCSGNQGGKMSQISKLAQEYAAEVGIPVAKGERSSIKDRDWTDKAKVKRQREAAAARRSARAQRFEQNREKALQEKMQQNTQQSMDTTTSGSGFGLTGAAPQAMDTRKN
jgi:hypothetical protein